MNSLISIKNKQWVIGLIYLFINGLFVLKFSVRAGFSPIPAIATYIAIVFLAYCSYRFIINKLHESTIKILAYATLLLLLLTIVFLLIKIDPLSVRVDRWSAVSYFIDSTLKGIYPYGTHTHVSELNYPSPFPVWYLINFPFYLLGDVGIGLLFFIVLTFFTLQKVFSSYRISFSFLFLLIISPAYWWEVCVRSDSLSNALLVFNCILFLQHKRIKIENNILLMIILCAAIACTRLSAIVPLAIFLFGQYINLKWNKKIMLLLGVLIVCFLFFAPFIFWNTENWIFFSRNPFMSQTSVGNPLVLICMLLLGLYLSLKWKSFIDFNYYTGVFVFIFILSSQLFIVYQSNFDISLYADSKVDISYFTLALPYVILSFLLIDMKNELKIEWQLPLH